MVEKGLLIEEDRIEIIDSYLLTKISISPSHSGTVNRLPRRLIPLLRKKVIVALQNPITIHEFSEPEPAIWCGIAESWLVNLKAREITVFNQPKDAGYARKLTYRGDDSLQISGFSGVRVSMTDGGL